MGGTGWAWARPRLLVRRAWGRLFPPPYGVARRAVVNGFPKAGTHLLVECVRLLGGRQRFDFFLDRKMSEEAAKEENVPLGIGEPRLAAAGAVERRLASLWPGEFGVGHIPHSARFEELLEKCGVQMLFILRDPRDIAVSLTYHTLNDASNRLHEHFTRTLGGFEQCLLAAIEGIDPAETRTGVRLAGIGEQVGSVRGWLTSGRTQATRFERLVGPRGGGSAEAQREEIGRLADHLGLRLTREQIEAVGSRLFGPSSLTFRRGQIGSWREHFRDGHKAAFKRAAGRQLIELGYERDLNW